MPELKAHRARASGALRPLFALVTVACSTATASFTPPVMDVVAPATRSMDWGRGWEGFTNGADAAQASPRSAWHCEGDCQPVMMVDYKWKTPTDLDMRAKLARLFNGGCGPHIHMTDAGSDFEAQVLEAGRLVYGEPTEQARSVGEHFSNAIDRISPAVRQAAGLSAAVVASAAYRQHFRTRSRTTV